MTAEVAWTIFGGGTIFLLEVLINKEWKEILRLSAVTFNKICVDLCPCLDKKALFALTRACN